MRRRTVAVMMTAVVAASFAAPLLSANATSVPIRNPLARTEGLYVDPHLAAAQWVTTNPADPRAAGIREAISSRPMARWFTGTSDADVGRAVAGYTASAEAAGHRLPVLVAYNLPGRDACGAQSAGGATGVAGYQQWISAFAAGIGDRPAIVILEPDALGDFACMTTAQIAARLRMLTFATRTLAEKSPDTWTYIDAGNATWTDPATMARRLTDAGIADAHGFAVNVSNYYRTAQSRQYADTVNAALAEPVGYVVDTSRNGNGDNGAWCNPAGRKLGTISTTDSRALLLWIKNPGNSDGACGIAANSTAGVFIPAIAQRLIAGS